MRILILHPEKSTTFVGQQYSGVFAGSGRSWKSTDMKIVSVSVSRHAMGNMLRRGVCRGMIENNYINKTLDIADHIFLFMHEKRDEVLSMGLLREASRDEMTLPEAVLDLLCSLPTGRTRAYSHHGGARLLEIIIRWCRAQNMAAITLTSLADRITFYAKFGFEFRKNCVQRAGVVVVERPQKDWDKDVSDTRFLEMIRELVQKGYGETTENCPVDFASLSESLRSGKCGSDGFKMRLCLKSPQPFAFLKE